MEIISEIAISSLRIFAACAIIVITCRYFFKKTIVYHLVAVMSFPITVTVLMVSFLGRGIIPVWVGLPIGVVSLIAGFAVFGKMLQAPLKEMLRNRLFLL